MFQVHKVCINNKLALMCCKSCKEHVEEYIRNPLGTERPDIRLHVYEQSGRCTHIYGEYE